MDTYRTTSRRLEQFLYAHFIHFMTQQRNEAGDMVWVYERTPRLMRTLEEYGTLCAMAGVRDDRMNAD